jgi:hypothetical protein
VPAAGAVRFDHPATTVAGEPVELTVHLDPAHPAPDVVAITVISSTGVRTREVPVVASTASLTIPAVDTETAGLLTVAVSGAGPAPATTEIDVRPGPAAAPLVPLIGPRTIVADGVDHTMTSLLVVDALGNPVTDGTEVLLSRRRPGGEESEVLLAVDHHVARTRLTAGTTAGRNQVSAELGDRRGPLGTFDEVAGPATPFDLSADPVPVLVADGRSLLTVTTDVLTDPHGNVLPDGTVVEFRVDGPGGISALPAVTIDGRSTVRVAAPDTPGPVSVTAHASGTASRPLDLAFDTGVSALPVVARPVDRDVRVEIGPVLDELGAHVADGRTAEVRIDTGTGSTTTSVRLTDGQASRTIRLTDPPAAGTTVTVTVGGHSTVVVTP